ncbi:MAG: sulfotransferase, partial [Kiloniellales bacterium]
YLGFIATILPGARTIDCRRDPLDTRPSLFSRYFSDSRPYAYSLERLGFYYRAYRRLMAHWRAVLPKSMLELDYEALVDDRERASRIYIGKTGLQPAGPERNSRPRWKFLPGSTGARLGHHNITKQSQ